MTPLIPMKRKQTAMASVLVSHSHSVNRLAKPTEELAFHSNAKIIADGSSRQKLCGALLQCYIHLHCHADADQLALVEFTCFGRPLNANLDAWDAESERERVEEQR